MFPCPACQAPVDGDPESRALRCPSCRAWLHARVAVDDGTARAYDVEAVGRPETRRRVLIPWDASQSRRLAAWLVWATALTLGLVAALYLLARWWR